MKTKGQLSFENGFNLKTEILEVLNENKVPFTKIIHHISSPYQKTRYKPEFIEQECWIYQSDVSNRTVVTEDMFNNLRNKKEILNYLAFSND